MRETLILLRIDLVWVIRVIRVISRVIRVILRVIRVILRVVRAQGY